MMAWVPFLVLFIAISHQPKPRRFSLPPPTGTGTACTVRFWSVRRRALPPMRCSSPKICPAAHWILAGTRHHLRRSSVGQTAAWIILPGAQDLRRAQTPHHQAPVDPSAFGWDPGSVPLRFCHRRSPYYCVITSVMCTPRCRGEQSCAQPEAAPCTHAPSRSSFRGRSSRRLEGASCRAETSSLAGGVRCGSRVLFPRYPMSRRVCTCSLCESPCSRSGRTEQDPAAMCVLRVQVPC